MLPLVARAAGLECIAYYHNEAAAGKDVCNTHFSHQQARVDAYISEGSGGRKVSSAKQLYTALATKLLKNTTILLVKPDFKAPFRSFGLRTIPGIASFYATKYFTSNQLIGGVQQHITKMSFFQSLGQYVPSRCANAPIIPPASANENPLHVAGMNFTGSAHPHEQ